MNIYAFLTRTPCLLFMERYYFENYLASSSKCKVKGPAKETHSGPETRANERHTP